MRMSPIKATIAAVSALCLRAAASAAAPNVTAVPLGTSCTSYPGFDGSGAGPFIAVAHSTGRAVDGIGLNAAYFVDGTRRYGYVIAPAEVPTRNITMRCAGGKLQARLSMVAGGEPTWEELVVSGDPGLEGALGFGFAQDEGEDGGSGGYRSIPLEPYWHFVGGEQVPGVFLGAAGSTTFGFAHNSAGAAGEYYLLRLLGTGRFNRWELGRLDTVGFLKVTYDY
ncbi:hypothetical protein SAMD00023353_0102750 [Rosellinia necatrix]|uniref:Uncharacterized protein n=1 Tax=Rosellinia necatrix TaxID=77044 RepID=A0A1S7UHW0_ROSNE|nr:hypothetical protein SAMD00023353_0102750 [Rosellinia necatrix]